MPQAQKFLPTAPLEQAFDEAMIALYRRTGKETKYWAYRYYEKVKRVGGLAAAKSWLNPKIDSTSGLQRLIEKNRIDLSMEALVLQEPWSSLFTPEELQIAQQRLNQAASVYPPEEILDPTPLTEGTVYQVVVNSYERNAQARKRCIAKYGAICAVCNFSFEQQFGAVAAGFIHVHHLIPLSEIGEAYKVDPIQDLRPVCPNCHAMIHLGGQTRTIEAVKAMLQQAKQEREPPDRRFESFQQKSLGAV